MNRIRVGVLALGMMVAAVPASAAMSDSDDCYDLWLSRNQIYKNAGYCFKTAKAIREFGNAGCSFDEMAQVPLSRADRAEVADIQRRERLHRCPK